ncbi:hypothetical protein LCGC14_1386490 [marine sediment metagenome]|uniref:Uncharacterized protein n=1 Tax=marine sediment metagenome TaxID=412755 RepID=A0A0F9K1H7_9ZZZZ
MTGKTKAKTRAASKKAFDAAVGGSSAAPEAAPTTVTLSCGVVLRFKPVPSLAIREAAMRIEAPTVPTIHIEDKNRDEENPNDSAYIQAVAEYEAAQALVANDVVLLLGADVEHVPNGVAHLDDDSWVQDLQLLGIEFDPDHLGARKLAWLKFYILRTDDDQVKALMGPMRSAGVGEGDVAKAMDSFRDHTARATDNGAGVPDSADGAEDPEPSAGAGS